MPENPTAIQTNGGNKPQEVRTLQVANFKLNQNGLTPLGTPTFEDWIECGKFIHRSNESVHFWIGDWLNYGEFRWGETYREAVSLFNFDIQTLRNDKWVSYKIPIEKRKKELSFTHFNLLAALDDDLQDHFLQTAVNEKLTVEQLRARIKKEEVFKHEAKKVSVHTDTSLKDERENLQAVEEARQLIEFLDKKLDQIQFQNLSARVKKEFFIILGGLERRCAGIEMEFGDE